MLVHILIEQVHHLQALDFGRNGVNRLLDPRVEGLDFFPVSLVLEPHLEIYYSITEVLYYRETASTRNLLGSVKEDREFF